MADDSGRAAWLEERRRVIGSSDAPAVLGVCPYKSALQVYAEKLGLAEPVEQTERMTWGLRLEGVIADAYAEETGRSVSLPPERLSIHPSRSWMGASLDRVVEDEARGRGVLELKTTSRLREGDELPVHWRVQVAHQLEVSGLPWASIAVLEGGNRLVWLDVEVNARFTALMVEREEEFWGRLQRREPPEPDGSESASTALRLLYPRDSGATVELGPDAAEWADKLERARAAKREAEEAERAASNSLKAMIGEATYAVLPDGTRYTFRVQRRQEHIVSASEFRVLRKVREKGA